jgi:hypothetical protein
VITYKSNVKELFFIQKGLVEVYNNENDEVKPKEAILYLPKHSYFGDYQILYNLKSNIVFKTMKPEKEKENEAEVDADTGDGSNNIIFMCIN